MSKQQNIRLEVLLLASSPYRLHQALRTGAPKCPTATEEIAGAATMDLPSQGAPKPKPRGPAIAGPPMMDLPMTGVASPMGAIAGVAKEIVRAPTMLVARGAANGAPIKPALAVAMVRVARTSCKKGNQME